MNVYLYYRRVKKWTDRLDVEKEFRYWQSQKSRLLQEAQRGYHIELDRLGLSAESVASVRARQQRGQDVVIADIDRNGEALSYYGAIENLRTIGPERFVPRRRFPVQMVLCQDCVGVRKTYAGLKQNFVNELKILHRLGAAGCHVPAILDVDFDNLTLTISYIAGASLREILTAEGAPLSGIDPDIRDTTELSERREARAQRNQQTCQILARVIDSEFIEDLYAELGRIHAAGVLDVEIKYGNVIVEQRTGQPYWIDFDHATCYGRLGARAFRALCQRDIEKFNLFFGTDKRVAADSRMETNDHEFTFARSSFASSFAFLFQRANERD